MDFRSRSGRSALSIGPDFYNDPLRTHRSIGATLIIGRLPYSEQGRIGARLRCNFGFSIDIGLPRLVRSYPWLARGGFPSRRWTGRSFQWQWCQGWFRVEFWGRGG